MYGYLNIRSLSVYLFIASLSMHTCKPRGLISRIEEVQI